MSGLEDQAAASEEGQEPLIGSRRDEEQPGAFAWSAPLLTWCPAAAAASTWCVASAALGALVLLVATFTVLLGGRAPVSEPMQLSLAATALDVDMDQLEDARFRAGFERAALRGVQHTSGDAGLTGSFSYAPDDTEGVRVATRIQFSAAKEAAAERLAHRLETHRLDGRGLFGAVFVREYGEVEVDPDSVTLVPVRPPPGPPSPAPQPPAPTPEPTSPAPDPPGPTTEPPEPTPQPPEPTPEPPGPAPEPKPPTPTPAPCPYKFVVHWTMYAGPHNATHFFNRTVPSVASHLAAHLGWSAQSTRIRTRSARQVYKRVSGCYPEALDHEQDGEEGDIDWAEHKEGVVEGDALNLGDHNNHHDHHHGHHHRKPAVTRGHFEVIFDTQTEGGAFGSWLIGPGGRHMVYQVLADDAQLCGAKGACSFVGLWKQRCLDNFSSHDDGQDEESEEEEGPDNCSEDDTQPHEQAGESTEAN